MLAIFGIDGGALSLVINLLVLFLIVTYLALIYWTYLDARRRIEDPVLIACATAASVFPFIGTIVYTILRPPEFLEDREERTLELRAAELRLRQLIEQSCPHCEYPIELNYVRCPNCERRLRNPCRKCTKPLDPKWGICPYCETEVRRQRGERTERSEREGGRRAERSERRDRAARPTRSAPAPSGGSEPRSDDPRRQQQQQRKQQQPSKRPAVGAQGRPQPQRPSGSGSGGSQRPSS
jgi:Double zinc ribbon